MLAEAFPLGSWKNLDEMEEYLTLDELILILDAERERKNEQAKFQAAINGIDLENEGGQTSKFDEIQARAQAELAGKTEEEFFFDMVGVTFED